jgi:hypothetical protein
VADPVKCLPLVLLVRIVGIGVSGLARFVILLFALSLASEAHRRMRGVEGWGRHLRSGSRAATKEVLALTHPSNRASLEGRIVV